MRLAIIDMGTNTFNLLIADTTQDKFNIIGKDKAGVKLGKGGINNKTITPEAFKRALSAIEKHLNTIRSYQVDRVIATATSGVRSTKNGKELVETIESKFGLKVEIISGDKEAELIYRGVKQAVSFNGEHALILDIGGGSNEFIIANDKGLLWKHSFNLGMARLLDMFQPSDPIRMEEIKKVEQYIDAELSSLYNAVSKFNPKSLIGCSGTFDSFREMIIARNEVVSEETKISNSYEINMEDYKHLHDTLLKSTTEERKKMEGLELVRVEMIVLASIFVNFIIKKCNLKTIIQSTFAIKEGLVDKTLNP